MRLPRTRHGDISSAERAAEISLGETRRVLTMTNIRISRAYCPAFVFALGERVKDSERERVRERRKEHAHGHLRAARNCYKSLKDRSFSVLYCPTLTDARSQQRDCSFTFFFFLLSFLQRHVRFLCVSFACIAARVVH